MGDNDNNTMDINVEPLKLKDARGKYIDELTIENWRELVKPLPKMVDVIDLVAQCDMCKKIKAAAFAQKARMVFTRAFLTSTRKKKAALDQKVNTLERQLRNLNKRHSKLAKENEPLKETNLRLSQKIAQLTKPATPVTNNYGGYDSDDSRCSYGR